MASERSTSICSCEACRVFQPVDAASSEPWSSAPPAPTTADLTAGAESATDPRSAMATAAARINALETALGGLLATFAAADRSYMTPEHQGALWRARLALRTGAGGGGT